MSDHWSHPDPSVRELITQSRSEALREAASDYAVGAWLDNFTEHNVEDDVQAVRAFCSWLEHRAGALTP